MLGQRRLAERTRRNMTTTYKDLKHWIVAFETTTRALLHKRTGGPKHAEYHIKAEPCSKHGDRCVWVLYGTLVEHFIWTEQDPGQLAESLLRTLLPHETGELP